MECVPLLYTLENSVFSPVHLPLGSQCMMGKPKSDAKKTQIKRESHDRAMARAVLAYKAEQAKGIGEKKKALRTICDEVARDWQNETGNDVKLNYVTLSNLAKGGKTLSEFNAEKSWLEKGEKDVVIEYIWEMCEGGSL